MTEVEKRSVTRGWKISRKDFFHPRLRPREQWSRRVLKERERKREEERRREKGRVHSHKALCLYTRRHRRYRPYWSFLGCSPAAGGASGSQLVGEGFPYVVGESSLADALWGCWPSTWRRSFTDLPEKLVYTRDSCARKYRRTDGYSRATPTT